MRCKFGLILIAVTLAISCRSMMPGQAAASAWRTVGFEWRLPSAYHDTIQSAEVWLVQDRDSRPRCERIDRSIEQLLNYTGAMYGMGRSSSVAADVVVRTRDFQVRDHGEGTALVLILRYQKGAPHVTVYLPEMALKADVAIPAIVNKKTIAYLDDGNRHDTFSLKDALGNPIEKGRASLVYESPAVKLKVWEGTTGEKGEMFIAFRNFGPDVRKSRTLERLHLEFADPGLAGQFTRTLCLADELFNGGRRTVDVRLAVPAAKDREAWRKTVEGRVYTLKGGKLEPYGGANVKSGHGSYAMDHQLKTDGKGRFAIYLGTQEDYSCPMRIEAPGFAPADASGKPGEKNVEVLLRPGRTVTFVLKEHDQTPLANRAFKLIRSDSMGSQTIAEMHTDAKGEASFDHLVVGYYSISGMRHATVKLEEGETRKEIRNDPPPPPRMSALVVDRRTGMPIAGVQLKHGYDASAGGEPLATTDAKGRIECPYTESGLVLLAPGYAPMPIGWGSKRIRENPTIKMNPTVKYTISVRDSIGRPVNFLATVDFEIHDPNSTPKPEELKFDYGPVYQIEKNTQKPGEVQIEVPLDFAFEILIRLPPPSGGERQTYEYPVPGVQRVTDVLKPAQIDVTIPPMVPVEIKLDPQKWDERLNERVIGQLRHPRAGSPWMFRWFGDMDPVTKTCTCKVWAGIPVQVELGIKREDGQGLYTVYRSKESVTLKSQKPDEPPRRIVVSIREETLRDLGLLR